MGFSKEPLDFFKNVNKLPDVLIDLIYEYVPKYWLITLSQDYYYKYHEEFVKKMVKQKETYIRRMIRQDNDFVLRKLYQENCTYWCIILNYYYREYIYSNYIRFLLDYAREHGSTKCVKLLSSR